MEIRYKLEAQSKGRNGFFTTSGVSMERHQGMCRDSNILEDVIEITTLTGKGQPSEAILLRIPKDKAAEVGRSLIELSKEK